MPALKRPAPQLRSAVQNAPPAAGNDRSAPPPAASRGTKPDAKILFQQFFKSVGPRTYAAQLKEAGNGNHFLVLTEGKRDANSNEVRKTRLFVFSEDFPAFFRLLHDTAQFIRANPVSDEVKHKRERFWARQAAGDKPGKRPAPDRRSAAPKAQAVR